MKAGNVGGEVNPEVDEALGQIGDAFTMLYYGLDRRTTVHLNIHYRHPRTFTANARKKIAKTMPKGLLGCYFLYRERITQFVERY